MITHKRRITMNIAIIKALLLIAAVGHIICWRCDWLITCTPNGRFDFRALNDNEKLSKIFDGTPEKNSLISMLLGSAALAMSLFGFIGIYEWMKQFSAVYSALIIVSAVIFTVIGTGHHIFCGAVEWIYIKLGRTEDARTLIIDLFKKTSVTMYVCYAGLLVFAVSFFIAVVSGSTDLPRWCCIFNTLPIFLVLSPFKIVGTGNLANALMFLGLFFVI